MNRRQFLLGAAAGLVLPSFYDKVFAYFENHGEPFLQAPRSADKILYASDKWLYETWELNMGDLHAEPPFGISIREFCQRFGEGDPLTWWREEWHELEPWEPLDVDLDAEMDHDSVHSWWFWAESPTVKAMRFLRTIDLGPQLQGAQAVGEILTVSGGMGSDYEATHALDDVSLSLLQNRLNELRTGIRIVVKDTCS